MDTSAGDTYRVRLRSLQWATGLVRELNHSKDVDAVAVATHWALDSVYDLFEAHQQAVPIGKTAGMGKTAGQDAWLKNNDAETIGGLLFARGEKTHQIAEVKGPNPFGEYPDHFPSFAALTDWTWAKASTTQAVYEQRSQWYSQRVHGRPLWAPLDHAEHWFVEHAPSEIPGQDARSVPDWVEGVCPRYRKESQ